ncbi:11352_t:CDS:2 [Ambispora leptoticha]|uniref:11352_t:CDS:1 n=1 Tax=Ambispora leptoticha TaxID=144679 RepID=A0A9N9DI12_9GLOM|nr:11352_t:CDS:2 [Ambispora leptoticha]
MTDFQETKLKYHRGTCFSCRKCMYCGIDLQQEKCDCDLSKVPHKGNRTDAVKYAFTQVFDPNWIKEKVEFVHQKIKQYNYLLGSKEAFDFTLCSRCNSVLLRLSSKAKKLKATLNSIFANNDNSSEVETCDLTTLSSDISESEEKLDQKSDKKKNRKEYEDHDDEELLSDEEVEYEYTYGIFIKLENGVSLPAKWYTAKVSTVDELVSEIHINIETLIGKRPIDPNNYRIVFKSKKAAGAGTQLVDTQDFKKFQSDYQKYRSKNINMAFFITFVSSSLKRKDLESDNNSDDDFIANLKTKNSIPKTLNPSSIESSIAKNVLEIRTKNHCIIYNRPCLNKDGAKENYVIITFMMLSIWASEINKAMASPTEPPTHPLFAYKYLRKAKISSQLQSSSMQFDQFQPSSSMQFDQIQPSSSTQFNQIQPSNSVQQLNSIEQPNLIQQYNLMQRSNLMQQSNLSQQFNLIQQPNSIQQPNLLRQFSKKKIYYKLHICNNILQAAQFIYISF